MTDPHTSPSGPIVVTGANGLVGSRVCAALAERGVTVRAVVRRSGTAPSLPGVLEWVGDFHDPGVAAAVTDGASAVVTTVHPMGSDLETQRAIGVEGTPVLARAAKDSGVERFVHVSTAAVYDRAPEAGDINESSPLVGDDGGDYPVTKRDTDAALADVTGLTTVLLRPPAILGASSSSVWNTLRPKAMREREEARHARPDATFPWVHVDDLAALAADVASGAIAASGDPARGPVAGATTALNVAAGPATQADYYRAVCSAVGVEPVWDDGPAWTGQISSARAHSWGWTPAVSLEDALSEVRTGLRD
ncbi:NAD-dependent epimerase/dehydratase family protein [Nocardioides sp.]|uniref:NAD-dependent epimerase/dehydratase family protein n=1 Tax=Nocardioides sp. TaxID=35761 RepID=UPI002B26B92E|nr:NAD-dependent epimerase/dehydratase family protein [Nocardioides sp.]